MIYNIQMSFGWHKREKIVKEGCWNSAGEKREKSEIPEKEDEVVVQTEARGGGSGCSESGEAFVGKTGPLTSSLYVPAAKTHIHTDTGTYRQTHRCGHRHTQMHACMHAPINKHKQTHTLTGTHSLHQQSSTHRHAEMYTYPDTQTNIPMHTMHACTRKAHTDRHTQAHSVISWNPPLWPLTIFPRSFPAEHVIPKLSTRGCSGASAELTESRT